MIADEIGFGVVMSLVLALSLGGGALYRLLKQTKEKAHELRCPKGQEPDTDCKNRPAARRQGR